jgi:hypothetical protein
MQKRSYLKIFPHPRYEPLDWRARVSPKAIISATRCHAITLNPLHKPQQSCPAAGAARAIQAVNIGIKSYPEDNWYHRPLDNPK